MKAARDAEPPYLGDTVGAFVAHGRFGIAPERSGPLSGLRFARHSPIILAQLVRTAAYSGAGSALWALRASVF